ncbi:MAG: hypothetical protein J6Q87_07765, partial [Clostridia bacterium]|nr:hypothetical protein [Clostridia bacterium]
MKKLKDNIIVELSLTTILLGLMVYASYSLWYIFDGALSSGDVHLYTALTSVALGWFMMMFVKTIFKNANWIVKLVTFLAGCAFFQGIIWGINAKMNPVMNDTTYNDDNTVITVCTVAFALSAILLLVTFIIKAIRKPRIVNIIFALIYFVVSSGGAFVLNEENIKALEYKQDIKFGTVGATEMNVSEEDQELCRNWFKSNFLVENASYPFTFKVDGVEFNPADWEKSFEPKTAGAGVSYIVDYKIVLKNKNNGLQVTVEATQFSLNATCQWTVYIKNTGTENSGVISDFYAINSALSTGKAELYYSMGSDTAASDFSLIKKNLSSSERVFSG